jgi:uncharacterized membrane protein (DUF2068 family)
MPTSSPAPPLVESCAVIEPRPRGDRALGWIAGYNLLKGLLVLALAVTVRGFLHQDVDTIVGDWIAALGVSLENLHVEAFLARLDLVTDHEIKVVSGVTFLFGGLFVTEGVGLFFRQRWAEFLTVIVTASFIPVEIFESCKHFGPAKLLILVVNVAIVAFLVRVLRDGAKRNAD